MSWLGKIFRHPSLLRLGAICAALSTAGGLVNDVLAPTRQYASLIGYALLGACLLTSLVYLAIKRGLVTIHLGSADAGGQTPAEVTFTLTAFFGLGGLIFLGFGWLTAKHAAEGGALGSSVNAVHEFQVDAGIVAETRKIQSQLTDIERKLVPLKKETSADPKKELENKGVRWNTQSFVDNIMSNTADPEIIELFVRSGMSPTTFHKGTSAVLYALQPDLDNRPAELIRFFAANGFDVNTYLVDLSILKDYSDGMLPPYYEAPSKPAGYAAWQGRFEGPALLWVAMLGAYRGPSADDLEVIAALKDLGARTEETRAFLDALKGAWGDTPSYQKIDQAVGG